MQEEKCKGCPFVESVGGKPYCKLAHEYVADLGRFCPKELSAEELKMSCRYYYPPDKTINGKVGICRVPLQEGGYSDPCLLEKPEDLLLDPDFKVKEEVC